MIIIIYDNNNNNNEVHIVLFYSWITLTHVKSGFALLHWKRALNAWKTEDFREWLVHGSESSAQSQQCPSLPAGT